MELTKEKVLEVLGFVIEPDLKKDVVSLGLVSDIKVEGNKIGFTLKINNPAMHNKRLVQQACAHQIEQRLGKDVEFEATLVPIAKDGKKEPKHRTVLPGVKNIIAVASGKGGVGKSTVTANLAVSLAEQGFKVGLIDADIYGPSIPLMFDVAGERPRLIEVDGEKKIAPVTGYGVEILSIGFFADTDQAVPWRGPMVTKALNQLIRDAHWGELDYMLFDLPPGTGDIHLTLVQNVPLTGAVIVSTPQEVALIDARKAVGMFTLEQINVPILGFVENMSYFTPAELPDNKYYIFGKNGVKSLADKMNINYLGEIPLVQSIREAGDIGRPAALQDNTPQSKAFKELAKTLIRVTDERNNELPKTKQVQIDRPQG